MFDSDLTLRDNRYVCKIPYVLICVGHRFCRYIALKQSTGLRVHRHVALRSMYVIFPADEVVQLSFGRPAATRQRQQQRSGQRCHCDQRRTVRGKLTGIGSKRWPFLSTAPSGYVRFSITVVCMCSSAEIVFIIIIRYIL